MESKIMSLKDAVAKYVKNGDHMVIGGFTTNRKPYALVYEILRQGFKDFVGFVLEHLFHLHFAKMFH